MSEPLPPEYRPRTIPDVLRLRRERHPDRLAVTGRTGDAYRTLTYAELDDLSSRLAAGLRARGLARPGRPVAWALGNDEAGSALVIYHAVLKAGAFNVPLNPRLAPAEIASLLAHCDATTLLGPVPLLDAVTGLAPGVRTVPGDQVERLSASAPSEPPGPGPGSDALASVLYTSGTTGVPKGVEHTHGSSLAAGIAWADCFRLREVDVLQSPFPVTSGAGLHFNGLSCLWSGAHVVVDEPRLPETFTRIDRYGTTVYVAVPSVYQYWLADPRLADYSLRSLRILDYGGASMAPAVIERLAERLRGVAFMQTYGFTEAGPGGTYLPEEYARSRLGSIGARAAGRHSRFRVVDDAGRDVGPGVDGELLFRGPSVMRGYHRDPETTAAVFANGWLRSGDVVRLDEEGFLYFVDRKRDLIVRGGYNIAPVEIEQALLRRADVVEAAAFGLPHRDLGEVPAAAVVLSPGVTRDETELIEHCAGLLADFKTPRRVFLLDELPKNAAGKALRRSLRARFAADPDSSEGPI
jgi:acyl-CoA synthetase (AMP-forming)/AMP-acid ligase II